MTLGLAYHGSSLVCYSVTYVEYKSVCRVVYAIPLWLISDIRELAIWAIPAETTILPSKSGTGP